MNKLYKETLFYLLSLFSILSGWLIILSLIDKMDIRLKIGLILFLTGIAIYIYVTNKSTAEYKKEIKELKK